MNQKRPWMARPMEDVRADRRERLENLIFVVLFFGGIFAASLIDVR